MAGKQKFTVKQVAEALRKTHGTISHAAELLACDDDTVQNYARRYKTVRNVIAHYRRRKVDTAELALDKALADGKPWAVALVLKTLGKGRGYVERSETRRTGETVIRIVREDDNAEAAAVAPGAAADQA